MIAQYLNADPGKSERRGKKKKAAGQIRYPNNVFHDAAGQEQLLSEKGDLEPRPGRGPFAQHSWELLLAVQEALDEMEKLFLDTRTYLLGA